MYAPWVGNQKIRRQTNSQSVKSWTRRLVNLLYTVFKKYWHPFISAITRCVILKKSGIIIAK